MKHAYPVFLILFLLSCSLFSQDHLQPTFQWRNIGPANQGGRIVDIEALNNDFTKVVIATGSGGVWKSDNAGTTWVPIFDEYETASIGDIAMDQSNPNVIWVGTGEANNRNSVSWGNGIYKSVNGGDSFQNMGLQSTHHIARVLVNPKASEEVCVCATGHLWGYSGDRGLFQTKNGGKSWEKLTNGLPNDGKTGCIDLISDPNNPKIMYAAFYHRLRQPWHFHSGGEMGGIYKTTNGGKSWLKLKNGLPGGPTGRIGLAIYQKNPKIVMAIVEAEKTDDLNKPGSGIYRSEDAGKTWKYVNTYNNRPFYYSQIRINPLDDQRVYVLTTRFMVSDDGGKTLRDGSEDQEVHGDFHAMWIDPHYKDRYYLGADKGLSKTHDHGQHFTLIDNLPIGQFYRIGFDMRDPYYVYGGLQDNGMYGIPNFTRDARGILSDDNWKLHWGDGQYVNVDPSDWRNMFTSMENGSFFDYDPLTYDIKRVSPNPNNILNFSDYFDKIPDDLRSNLRFNWSAPLVMSPFDPNTLYAAGNHVYKTTNRGLSWMIISPDLSTNDSQKSVMGKSGGITLDNTGAETHCSATSLSISPITESVIWIGTDDGQVQLTKNGGRTWTNLRDNISGVPDDIWVSRIEASHFDQGTAYLSFDGHRSDHFEPWIFKTTDFGQTWTKLTHGISENEVVRVIREDLRNPNLLFAGTETSIWYSVDAGQNWERFMPNLPTVSVYDLKIHPRDNDLIAGTHGRSIWIMDDISPLQQLSPGILESSGHLFKQPMATIWHNTSRGGQRGHFLFAGDNPSTIENTTTEPRAGFVSKAAINYYLGKNVNAAKLVISDLTNTFQHEVALEPKSGIHRYYWNLEFDPKPYTNQEEEAIKDLLEELLQRYNYSAVRRMNRRFNTASTATEQRKAIEPLANGYLSVNIEPDLLMPKAKAGVYQVKLMVDGKELVETLEIRDDPMK